MKVERTGVNALLMGLLALITNGLGRRGKRGL
jgi:hypothetical protein